MLTNKVVIGNVTVGGGEKLLLIAGPCVIESEELCLAVAAEMKRISEELEIPYLFKASYDKANRLSADSFRGPGLEEGLKVLAKVKSELDLPVTSDVHCREQVASASEVLDLIQVPALLSRQTDLVQAVARTGKPVNIKKGQFLAPWNMKSIVEKARAVGNDQIILTERGTSFGYGNLVADMRSIPIMQETGCPVIFDATHSVQLPGGQGSSSGGEREMIPYLAAAAVAAGCDGLFFEVHPDPDKALCDGPNMMSLAEMKLLLEKLLRIREAILGAP